jgi:hypothetical protein
MERTHLVPPPPVERDLAAERPRDHTTTEEDTPIALTM